VRESPSLLELLDADHVRDLVAGCIGGVPGGSAEALLLSGAESLRREGVDTSRPACAFFVPGRIEVLGKHTDYAGGRSLLAALDRGVYVVAAPRADAAVVISDTRSRERVSFPFTPELRSEGGWHGYPMAVARRLARDFPGPLSGADIAFASDLPPAAGMSSSSSLMIAVFLVLSAANELSATKAYRENLGTNEELADYLAAIESGRGYRGLAGDLGVGTHGGSQDHTAILCARPGELVQYAFGPVRFERAVPLPADHAFMVAVSGVRAEKTGAAMERYNRAAEQARLAARLCAPELDEPPLLGSILEADPRAADRLMSVLRDAPLADSEREEIRRRIEQFVEETRIIVPGAGDALCRNDLDTFGALVDRSQCLAITALQNQVAETIHLAHSARELGARAASAFGAGFGGSVWALVPHDGADSFVAKWRADYLGRFPHHSDAAVFFVARAGAPALRLA
jgi:galactokinase